ncbi:hypothetical protein RM844_03275 [Streptomyces sp. DSM 44915]|uniref:Lipoprotein n=1 Tax=Streptomyces chisholmiae TaxID=3075540 RepID=A0ABU2JK02_9ACTN|nr:hypothetical protein [Streptomyces sp. DSM 44915]MDT0265308.1 hypothetical protein [Streptomyces sp. DSM 44915]
MSGGHGRRRRVALPWLLLATAATTACGIRPTDVPVDAGPAPTRASCDVPAGDEEHAAVFLVCGQRVESVSRPLHAPLTQDEDPSGIAAALLAELQTDPAQGEKTAGFSSDVPDDLAVTRQEPGDQEQVVRLSQRPNDLPGLALTQIICTFANSEALGAGGQTVTLGGPPGPGAEKPRTYSCSAAMRSPEGARSLG